MVFFTILTSGHWILKLRKWSNQLSQADFDLLIGRLIRGALLRIELKLKIYFVQVLSLPKKTEKSILLCMSLYFRKENQINLLGKSSFLFMIQRNRYATRL